MHYDSILQRLRGKYDTIKYRADKSEMEDLI